MLFTTNNPAAGRRSIAYPLAAAALIAAFIITFAGLAIQSHWAFGSGFDIGTYNQVVWNTLHGRPFFYTSTGQPLLHLSNHADPVLLLLAPFYLIYSGPETLLVIQAALLGLAGWPVYALASQKLHSRLAGLAMLAAYLLFPGTEVVTLAGFHPPALAAAFLIAAFYFLETRRPGRFLLFAVLAMACKEQIPLQVIFLGLYALLRQRNWRLGLFTMALGAAWFITVMYWVIPTYSVTGEHIFLYYYADFGSTPLQIIFTVLTRPDLVWQTVWQPARLIYLRDLLAPFGFLPLLGWPTLLVGLPSLAINLLSNNPAMYDATRGHYVADMVPWVVWAALDGLALARAGLVRLIKSNRLGGPAAWLGGLLAAVALGWHLFYGFSPLALDAPRVEITPHDRLGWQLVKQIPPDAAISAQYGLFAHLSDRHIAYVFPVINEADYILLDVTSDTVPYHPYPYRDEVKKLLKQGEFGILAANDGYVLLKRGVKNNTLPNDFYTFARVSSPAPQYPLNAQFGGDLRLLGFDLLDNPRRGETSVRLYWQALQPIKSNKLRLYPFFVDAQGQVVEDTSLRPLTTQLWYPPQQWSPGEIVTAATLPWTLGDQWSLAVGVLAGSDWSNWNDRLRVVQVDRPDLRRFDMATWVRLATFRREGRYLTQILPTDSDLTPPHALEADFDDKLKLLGYGVSPQAGQLTVTLYWQARQVMGYDYTVFVHLLDAEGHVLAQHDGQPWWDESIPTTTWLPGETLRDRHTLVLPSAAPPGPYTLRVGVYYWQTLERLPVRQNGVPVSDAVDLGPMNLP